MNKDIWFQENKLVISLDTFNVSQVVLIVNWLSILTEYLDWDVFKLVYSTWTKVRPTKIKVSGNSRTATVFDL